MNPPKTITRRILPGIAALLMGASPALKLPLSAAPDDHPAESQIGVPGASDRLSSRETLLFRNGDLLYGALEAIDPSKGLLWRHSDVDRVIQFRADAVAEVHFPVQPLGGSNVVNACRCQLNNGDELEGSLVRLDQERAVLQTWYAGEISLPRRNIQSIVPILPEGRTVFFGPTGLEGWTIGKVVSGLGDAGEWKYKNGAFYATNAASIARDVKLPDVAKIEFDLAWKGIFQLAVALYTDYYQPINLGNKDSEPEFGGFYSLQLNSFSANLLPVKKNDPLRYLGQVSVPMFNQKNTAHVEVRASKPKRTISLLVDGQLVKQWSENEEFVGQGTGVRFVHQGQVQSKVKLSHFRVSEWDGQFDEKPTPNPDRKQDIAKLRNGDKVVGTLESIQDGRVSIATGGTNLEIPLGRVKQIELAQSPVRQSSPDQGNIRAFFRRGGAVTFQLERWEANKVMGTSPNFGRLAFDASAFSRVELDLKGTAQ
jgi:hypothetical protein